MDSREAGCHQRLLDKRESYRVNIRRQKKQEFIRQCRRERLEFLDQQRQEEEEQSNSSTEEDLDLLVECIHLLIKKPRASAFLGEAIEQLERLGQLPNLFLEEHGHALCSIALQWFRTYEGCIFAQKVAFQQDLSKYLLDNEIINSCLNLIEETRDKNMIQVWIELLHEIAMHPQNIGKSTKPISKCYLMLLEKSQCSQGFLNLMWTLSSDKDHLPQQEQVLQSLFKTWSSSIMPSKRQAAEGIIGNIISLADSSALMPHLANFLDYCCELLSSNSERRRRAKKYLLELIKKVYVEDSEHLRRIIDLLGTIISVESQPEQVQSLELARALFAGACGELFVDLLPDSVLSYIVHQGLTTDNIELLSQAVRTLIAFLSNGAFEMRGFKMEVRRLLENISSHASPEVAGLALRAFYLCPGEHE